MVGAVASMGKYDLWIVWSEVVTEEGGNDFSACHPRDAVFDQGFQSLEVLNPLFARDDSWLWYFFWYGQSWSILASILLVFFVRGWWRPRVYRVWHAGSRWEKDIRVGDEEGFIV